MKKTNFKYLAEFRYKPLPAVLDKRGEIVQATVTQKLTEWVIGKDRVDVLSGDQLQGVFVGFQNCGFASSSSDDLDHLLGSLNQGIKILPEQHYGRIGLRLIAIYESGKGFKTLLNSFKQELMKNDFVKKTPYKTSIKDVAVTYVLSEEKYELFLHLGPMDDKQAKGFFPSDKTLPKAGVFIDLDCYTVLKPGDNFKDIRRFVHFARERLDSLAAYMGGVVEASNARKR